MSDEKIIFRGSPSQVLNADVFAGCALVAIVLIVLSIAFWWAFLLLLPVPIGIAAWKWLELKCRVFEVTSERIRMSQGIFTRRTDELELYRVNDISVVEPFILRSLGLGHVVLTTNDTSTPVLTISAVRRVKELREELRKCVETCRERKRVRVTEME
jgi:membrane protein YdbS with pleckstrin-like domain